MGGKTNRTIVLLMLGRITDSNTKQGRLVMVNKQVNGTAGGTYKGRAIFSLSSQIDFSAFAEDNEQNGSLKIITFASNEVRCI